MPLIKRVSISWATAENSTKLLSRVYLATLRLASFVTFAHHHSLHPELRIEKSPVPMTIGISRI